MDILKAGFIGLGNMGAAVAHNLIKAGYTVTVHNRTKEKAESLLKAGAIWAESPAKATRGQQFVFSMLTDDEAVMEISQGEQGILSAIEENAVHISLSSIAGSTSEKLELLHKQKNSFLVVAPVFGKPEAAVSAKLWIATSGPEEAKKRIKPLLEAVSQGVYDFGENIGAANIVKLAGNFLIGSAIEAMAEAFTISEKNGIDRLKVYEFFSSTLFTSPVFKNYGKMIAEENYLPVGAPPALIRKDMRLLSELAQKSIVPMPLLNIVFSQLSAMVAKGNNQLDWAGFAGEVSEDAGLKKS